MANVVAAAHTGCFISVPPSKSEECQYVADWCLNCESLEQSDDDEEEMPDLSIDPDDGVLSIYNSADCSRTFYVTIENCARIVSGRGEDLLDNGAAGSRRECITFIVLMQPRTVMDMCTLVPKLSPTQKKNMKKNGGRLSQAALESIKVTSDIQEYIPTEPIDPALNVSYDISVFPLQPPHTINTMVPRSWLCTQSEGGSLTHFAHPSTFHAVDFRCPVGTPVVAVFDGVVVEVKGDSTVTGVHVANLFHWNSIMIKKQVRSAAISAATGCSGDAGEETVFAALSSLAVSEPSAHDSTGRSPDSASSPQSEGDLYVEYVHISSEGIFVSEGDVVCAGQVICLSGEAGFCPEPHLHLQVQRSRDVGAPSVPLTWKGAPFKSGQLYP
jgi:murein DD-endopeptidase MepM/ murein hydrolase activator NlpD